MSSLPRGPGKLCGKVVRCMHPCVEEAGLDHICSCRREWRFNLGCGHWMTGKCSDFTNFRLICLDTCGKVLSCGHPCFEACSSFTCFCHVCFDKHSTVTGNNTDTTNKTSITCVTTATLKLAVPKPASSKLPMAAGPEVRSNKAPKVGRSNDDANCKPGSSKMANSSGSPPAPPFNVMDDTDEGQVFTVPIPQSLESLPAHQFEQVQELLLQSAVNKDDRSTWDFMTVFNRCINEHVFPEALDKCPICGGPIHGPNLAVFNMKAGIPETREQESDPNFELNEENAWKLGLTKCLHGHYFFDATRRNCNVCGMPSVIQLPDGYYSDSD